MAAALSHPFFLAAAAAASSRDTNESTATTPRISSYDDHHHLTSSSTIKRSISPCFLSKQNDENTKKFAPLMNNNLIHSNCFTPPITTNSSPSLLSQVSKLKIITKGNLLVFILFLLKLLYLETNLEQQSNEKSVNLSIELNGIAYQGTLYATTLTGSKE